MCSKFQLFSKAIPLTPEKVQTVVMAACCIHNFLLQNPTSTSQYLTESADTVCELETVAKQAARRANNEAIAVRNNVMRYMYFNIPAGAVSWQKNVVQ